MPLFDCFCLATMEDTYCWTTHHRGSDSDQSDHWAKHAGP
jgi:hypothetical protein